MHRATTKSVPRLLTDEQTQNRVIVSQELLARANADENCLKNVLRGDETWVYCYNVETKRQLSQGVGALLPRPEKHV